MSKRFNMRSTWLVLHCLITIVISPNGYTQPAFSAEQERHALIKYFQQKFPGTGPQDWSLGAEGLTAARGVAPVAIPFNVENATNTADVLAIGKKQWERKFKDGRSLAACFPNAGKRVAATYPQYDTKSNLVVTLEMAINRCLQLHGEAEINAANSAAMGPLVAYFTSLSVGQKLTVRVSSAGALEKFREGKALFQRRMGQLDMACASCHVLHAGESYAGLALSPVIGQAVSWPRVEPGGGVRTIQMQFATCLRKIGAERMSLGSMELNSLEFTIASWSNGLSILALTSLATRNAE